MVHQMVPNMVAIAADFVVDMVQHAAAGKMRYMAAKPG